MKLGGHTDYHGSRTYAPDPPTAAAGGWIRRHAGPLSAWATQMFEMLLKPGARQAAETVWLVQGQEKHFSLLGLNGQHEKRRRNAVAACAFPEDEVRIRRPIQGLLHSD